MRKVVLSLGLCLLLFTAQMEGIVHELSHATPIAHQDARLDVAGATPTICGLCLAFSQLANPAVHSTETARFEPTSCAAGAILCPANLPADVPTARSRGPPVQLDS